MTLESRVPVLDAIRRLVCGMSMGSFMGLGHALHRWLSGWVMSKHDARFSGRQEHLRDLCTKAPLGRNSATEENSQPAGQPTFACVLPQRSSLWALLPSRSSNLPKGGTRVFTRKSTIPY